MNSSVTAMVEMEDALHDIIYLQVANVVENRFRKIFKCYYKSMIQKYYLVRDGRIYLIVTEPICYNKTGVMGSK